jgi:hypothetical protein
LCSFHQHPVTSSLLGTNILLSILFWNTLGLRSPLNVRDQVSHPYRSTDSIIVLCIPICLISSWIKFWFVTVVLKYLNCATFSKDLLAIFMSWFRLPF